MRRLFSALFAIALMLAAACSERAPVRFHSTDISGAEFGRSLAALKDQHGKRSQIENFKGKAVIVFFGYTACPDVCPTTLARFAELSKQLGQDAARVQVLLVSLDPERDTPEKLGAYVTAFDPSFIGLTGDPSAIEAVAREFKVFFTRRKIGQAAPPGAHDHDHGHAHADANSNGDDAYLLDHSAGAYVFDPAGRVRLYVSDTASTTQLAEDIRALLAGK